MARYSSPQMAKVLERLELERPQIVTIGDLAKISAEEGVATSAAVLAARMRERGWLLPFQRKLYADREGRFSLDLDFAELVEGAGDLFVMEADGLSIGPFGYGVAVLRDGPTPLVSMKRDGCISSSWFQKKPGRRRIGAG